MTPVEMAVKPLTKIPVLDSPRRLLMGPGPSDTHPRVLAALSRSTVGHMDPWFLSAMNDVATLLRYTFQTENALTLAAPGTGSAGMEAMFTNLVEPGDAVLVATCGYFGQRLVEMARRHRADLTIVSAPFGRIVEPAEVIAPLRQKPYKVVALVHAETSTGVLQPLEEIAAEVRRNGALLVLDTVTSLASVPVLVDAWGVDGVYSCSQKGLACPPGLAPVSFSERAVAKMMGRREKPVGWYLDMSIIRQYWGTDRVYHHTAPTNMTFALFEGLRLVAEEGLPARWERHRRNGAALRAGLLALGLSYLTQPGYELPQLHCVGVPEGVDDVKSRRRLLDEFGIEIGGGLGEFKGRAWRVGLMGEVCQPCNIVRLLEALGRILIDSGRPVSAPAAIAAAETYFRDRISAA